MPGIEGFEPECFLKNFKATALRWKESAHGCAGNA